MAILNIEDIIRIIKEHPEYEKWKMGVPPEQALSIEFGDRDAISIDNKPKKVIEYITAEGDFLILEIGEIDEKVYSIEIS